MKNSTLSLAWATSLLLGTVTSSLAQDDINVLSFNEGAVLMSLSNEFGDNHAENWIALGLIDGTPEMGWSSKQFAAFPHQFVFEFSTDVELSSFEFDALRVEEDNYPGISPREIMVEAATQSAQGPFTTIVSTELEPAAVVTYDLVDPAPARWLRLSILSNWGAPDFTELMEVKAFAKRTSQRQAVQSLEGTYSTNWNDFFIRTRGRDLIGCYDVANGVFSGAPSGWFMNLEWREDGPSVGTATMAITESGSHFSGFFYNDAGVLDGTWAGSRTNKSPLKCVDTVLGGGKSRVAIAMDASGRASLYGLYFDHDSSSLKPESTAVLEQVLEWMKSNESSTVGFSGHTDSDGGDDHNLVLSQQRAEAVVAWLENNGIASTRMRAIGHGESKPVADNGSDHGKSLNRRVEITVEK